MMFENIKLAVRVQSFPKVFPASYFWEEGVSRAGGVGRRLSVALDGEIGHQPSSFHCTSDETMAQQVQGMARRKCGSVVTNDWHAVPDGIVPSGVCPEVFPTSAFIDVAVRAHHEAEGTNLVDVEIKIGSDILYYFSNV